MGESIVGIDENGDEFPCIIDQSTVLNVVQEEHLHENEDDNDVLNSSNRLNYELLMAAATNPPPSGMGSVSFDNQSMLKSCDDTLRGLGQTGTSLIDLSSYISNDPNKIEEGQNGIEIPVLLSDIAKEASKTYLVDTEASKMRSASYSLQVYTLVLTYI
jgi:hypothetical protein